MRVDAPHALQRRRLVPLRQPDLQRRRDTRRPRALVDVTARDVTARDVGADVAFSRFLTVAGHANATEMNFEIVARDAQVPARTVREYFPVLVDTLVGRMVGRFP